ncbi:MAG: VOC family protein [Gemmatimonadaceae bacterium]
MDRERGRFVWYELMTSDPEGAKKFYTGVTGWGTTPFEGMPYTMWTNEETPMGGLMQLPAELASKNVPPHWLPYVLTPDVDATVKQAEKLGARVNVPPTDIPNMGRFAVLADPQGAVFAVYSGQSDSEIDAPPKRGQFSWHELATTDHAAAFDFYSKLFGWEKDTAMDMGPAGIYQIYGKKGKMLGGMYNKPSDMPVPPNWLLYVQVDDINTAISRVKNLGGQVLNGPMDVPGGQIAQCMDPQGAAFALHATAEETARAD